MHRFVVVVAVVVVDVVVVVVAVVAVVVVVVVAVVVVDFVLTNVVQTYKSKVLPVVVSLCALHSVVLTCNVVSTIVPAARLGHSVLNLVMFHPTD